MAPLHPKRPVTNAATLRLFLRYRDTYTSPPSPPTQNPPVPTHPYRLLSWGVCTKLL